MSIRLLLGFSLLAFAFFHSGQANALAANHTPSPPYNHIQ